jgi:hypothetical protein
MHNPKLYMCTPISKREFAERFFFAEHNLLSSKNVLKGAHLRLLN